MVLAWLLSHKVLLVLVAATAGLTISTTYLGVDNANLREEIETLQNSTETTHPVTTSTPPVTTPAPENMENYRLPKNVKPKSYDLMFKPDLKTGLFVGRVKIDVDISRSTNVIKLHSHTLDIENATIGGEKCSFTLDEKYQLLILEPGRELGVGNVELDIHFSGDMKNRIVGLYTSSYSSGGKEVTIATSKFEPTYARQAFPCFDEPNLKANFTVHLLKPKTGNYIALSNMPEEPTVTELEDGYMVDFQPSVPMSTYLACFIVSDFVSTSTTIESENNPAIPFQVFATPAQLTKTQYAGTVGKAIMEFYLGYFKIPYPLPKLDMVAIPDFVSGAMEHWGLVTFRETALLFDPSISSSANKQRVATVVAHELAHSWFGNLVTMDWWNDLWLNEGFASYIEYKGVDAAEKSWKMLDQFIVEDMHSVLTLDATLGSHPIVQTVETPDQITEIFDTISYNKGASILRMLESAIGEDVFQTGVTNYLKKYQYGNAITQHLLDELQALVPDGLDVTDFMSTFTVQMGYPIVNVEKTDSGYRLSQKRFLKDPDAVDKTPTKYNYRWTIPVTYITKQNPQPKTIWFNHTDDSIELVANSDWIKFNYHQTGYYRVNYPADNWNKLIANLQSMDVVDRTHLLEESFRIAEASQLSYDIPLEMTKNLKNDFEYILWRVASTMLKEVKNYLTTSPSYTDFKEYVINIITPAYENYTWDENDEEDFLAKRARVIILDLACSMGHKDCLDNAAAKLKSWFDGDAVSQDLNELVYLHGMVSATKDDWDKMWTKFVDELDAGEKLRLLRGLCSINDLSILRRLLDLGKDDTYIRAQDYFSFLNYISKNPIGTNLIWDYVREHWDELVERFTLNDRNLGRLIPSITSNFASEIKLDEMKAFFEKYPNAGAGVSARRQALETVENNIKWLKTNKVSVESWIQRNKDAV